MSKKTVIDHRKNKHDIRLFVFRPIANRICLPLLKLSSLRHWPTVCKVMSVFLELQMTSIVFH